MFCYKRKTLHNASKIRRKDFRGLFCLRFCLFLWISFTKVVTNYHYSLLPTMKEKLKRNKIKNKKTSQVSKLLLWYQKILSFLTTEGHYSYKNVNFLQNEVWDQSVIADNLSSVSIFRRGHGQDKKMERESWYQIF